jgi:hypothetical protein
LKRPSGSASALDLVILIGLATWLAFIVTAGLVWLAGNP